VIPGLTSPSLTTTSALSRPKGKAGGIRLFSITPRPLTVTGGNPPVPPAAVAATLVGDEGRAAAVNYGGGARWFIREHITVGFDLRLHRIAAVGTQPTTYVFVFALSVGLSVR
jgi:hypothetical protein